MATLPETSFNKFAARVLQALKIRTTPQASDAQLVNGKTTAQVRALVTKATIGLSNLTNGAVATQAEAEAAASAAVYMTPVSVNQLVNKQLVIDNKVKGYAFSGFSGTQAAADKLCYRMNIVTNATEQTTVQNYKESFATVFNNWSRFSHGSNGLFPSNSYELKSWSYDSATDKISCTVNSNTLVGFVSADAYDTFDFEVELSSTNSDDDWIGVVIAFVDEAGAQHTLTAVRSWNSNTVNNFALYYNLGQSSSTLLASSAVGLGLPTTYHNTLGTLKSGWVGAGAIRIKVSRVGDVITVLTTNPGDTSTYMSAYPLSVDLNSLASLSRFKGPQRFGYCCRSQASSSWLSLQRPGDRVPIIRTDTLDTYVYTNNAWVIQPAGSHRSYLHKRRLHTNQITGKLFWIGDSLDVILPVNKGS